MKDTLEKFTGCILLSRYMYADLQENPCHVFVKILETEVYSKSHPLS